MENLLSFLTGILRQKRMTVDEFCRRIGISRQKFYRFVREPRRFTDEQVLRIIETLSLDSADTVQLRAYIRPAEKKDPAADSADYSDMITGIITRHLSREFSVMTANIEYTEAGKPVTMESPATLARIMSAFEETADGSDHHDFVISIFNCVPEQSCGEQGSDSAAVLTIARIVRELEQLINTGPEPLVHIRHYLSRMQCRALEVRDPGDKKAMLYNLRLLDALLPLLSAAEDYSIDQSAVRRQSWPEHLNYCLIRHSCGSGTEYFVLSFSADGGCRACRLGTEEVSHIYRFLECDNQGKDEGASERKSTGNPNQLFYQLDAQSRFALIHPDLCFDDIPREMWMALFEEVESRSDRAVYETAFRNLMDPYDQYSFLSFRDLVEAALNMLEQRINAGEKNNKIVICHSDGLAHLARTGVILDLITDEIDLTGGSWSPSPVRFPAPLVRQLLEVVRASIVRRCSASSSDPLEYDWLNYYILNPKFPCPEISLVIYKDLGVVPIYNMGRHKNRVSGLFPNPAIAALMYDYVVNTMIRKRGERLLSDILSDEHSLALIDRLIATLDQEQADRPQGDEGTIASEDGLTQGEAAT